MCVCPTVCLPVCLSPGLSFCLSVCRYLCLIFCLSRYLYRDSLSLSFALQPKHSAAKQSVSHNFLHHRAQCNERVWRLRLVSPCFFMQTAFEFEMKTPAAVPLPRPLQQPTNSGFLAHSRTPSPATVCWWCDVAYFAAPCGNSGSDMTTLCGICVHWHFVCKHYAARLPLCLSLSLSYSLAVSLSHFAAVSANSFYWHTHTHEAERSQKAIKAMRQLCYYVFIPPTQLTRRERERGGQGGSGS